MRTGTLVVYLLFLCLVAEAQTLQPVGAWREHLPYNRVVAVEEINGIIWAATPNALFSLDPADNTIERITRISGLTGRDIRTIGTDGSQLIVIYSDGNIDIIGEQDINNISDINNNPLTANKLLNKVYSATGKTWIAGNEAIYLLDTEKNEIRDTYIIGDNGSRLSVNDLHLYHDTLFAATGNGLRAAPINTTNLSDFRNWYLQPSLTGNIDNVVVWQDRLVCRVADTVYIRDNQDWSVLYTGSHIKNISAEQQLLISETGPGNEQLTILNDLSSSPVRLKHALIKYPVYSLSINEVFWIADNFSGLIAAQTNGTITNFIPASPIISSGMHVTSDQHKTVFTGGINSTTGLPAAQLSILSDGEWKNYDVSGSQVPAGVSEIISVAIHPLNGSVWAGSNGNGLLHFDNDNITIFGANSFVKESEAQPGRFFVPGLAFDLFNTLWLSNAGADQPLIARKDDGTTLSFKPGFSGPGKDFGKMVIDELNQKWIVASPGNGVIVFNHGQSLENTADDQWKPYRAGAGNGNLPSDNVNCLAVDKDGFVWIGTDAGIAIIRCASEIFSLNGCEAFRPVVRQDNFAGYLFANENVRAIAVDGANRKWIGTTNGIWLLSADGEKIILRFTAQNSPLQSNNINSISIDPKTGEVFFATVGGLSSYRSTATDSKVNNNPLLIFPNPVPPGYNGTIAISGVPQNAIVKITALDGSLVYQTRALGAQAVWNGRDYRGRKISSGVYLVLISGENNKQLATGKIIYVNK